MCPNACKTLHSAEKPDEYRDAAEEPMKTKKPKVAAR